MQTVYCVPGFTKVSSAAPAFGGFGNECAPAFPPPGNVVPEASLPDGAEPRSFAGSTVGEPERHPTTRNSAKPTIINGAIRRIYALPEPTKCCINVMSPSSAAITNEHINSLGRPHILHNALSGRSNLRAPERVDVEVLNMSVDKTGVNVSAMH